MSILMILHRGTGQDLEPLQIHWSCDRGKLIFVFFECLKNPTLVLYNSVSILHLHLKKLVRQGGVM